jgi:hypothetical protein
MTSPTNSATKHRGPASRLARRWRLFPRPNRRREDAPPPAGPRFQKLWKEVAPGQWQWLHIDDEADSK